MDDNLRHAYLSTRLCMLEKKLDEEKMVERRNEDYFGIRAQLLKRSYSKRRTNRDIMQSLKHQKEKRENEEEARKEKNNVIANPKRVKVVEKYAFNGMYRIFDHHRASVNRVCFANLDRTRIAMSCVDGTVSIVRIALEDLKDISGNENDIRYLQFPKMKFGKDVQKSGKPNDLCWSNSNDWILVVYESGFIVLYETAKLMPVRVLKESVPATVCKFHPLNSNHFLVGTSSGSCRIYSASTGSTVSVLIDRGEPITSATFASNASVLFVGFQNGRVKSFVENKTKTGYLPLEEISVVKNRPINCLNFHSWNYKRNTIRELLVNAPGHKQTLILLRLSDKTYKVLPKQNVVAFNVKNSGLTIRSAFCPLTPSSSDGACVVSASEDSSVLIYDVVRIAQSKNALINKLSGHFAPVLDVCWSFDESFLASCDLSGVVIVWKRVQQVESADYSATNSDSIEKNNNNISL